MNDVSSTGIYVSYGYQLLGTTLQQRNIVIVLLSIYIISLIVTIVSLLKTKKRQYNPIQVYYIMITVACILFAIIASYLPYILKNIIQNETDYHETLKYICMLYIFLITPILLRILFTTFGKKNPKTKITTLFIHPLYYFLWFILIYGIQNTNVFTRIPYVGFLFKAMKFQSIENLLFFEINLIVVIVSLLAYILMLYISEKSSGTALSILCKNNLPEKDGVAKMDSKCYHTISVEKMFIPFFVTSGFMFYKFIWVPFLN